MIVHHDGHTLGEICDSYGLPHDPEVASPAASRHPRDWEEND